MINNTHILAVVSVIFLCPAAGGILAGLNRKLHSYLQYRHGASIFQPFYDTIKLLGKNGSTSIPFQMQFILLNIVFIMFAAYLILMGQDLLLIIACVAFAEFSRIVAIMLAKSPFYQLNARKETINAIVYITLLLLAVVNIKLITGSYMTRSIYAASSPLIYDIPLTYLVIIFAILLKLGRAPFDYCAPGIRNRGSLERLNTGFSRTALALINISSWYETILLMFLASVFIAKPLWIGIFISLLIYFLFTLIDSLTPTSTWKWTVTFWWPVAGLVSIINVVWMCLGS